MYSSVLVLELLIAKPLPLLQVIKKNKTLKGKIESFPKHNIYLNVNHLETGKYTLKIIYKNKIIKKTSFKKII